MAEWLPVYVYEWATARNQLGSKDALALLSLLKKCAPMADVKDMPILELRQLLWELSDIREVTSGVLSSMWKVRAHLAKHAHYWLDGDSASIAGELLQKVRAWGAGQRVWACQMGGPAACTGCTSVSVRHAAHIVTSLE